MKINYWLIPIVLVLSFFMHWFIYPGYNHPPGAILFLDNEYGYESAKAALEYAGLPVTEDNIAELRQSTRNISFSELVGVFISAIGFFLIFSSFFPDKSPGGSQGGYP